MIYNGIVGKVGKNYRRNVGHSGPEETPYIYRGRIKNRDEPGKWAVYRWEGGGECSVNGRWGKAFTQTFSNVFLKTSTEGAVTTKAGSLFQYFITLAENVDRLLRRWIALWSTL